MSVNPRLDELGNSPLACPELGRIGRPIALATERVLACVVRTVTVIARIGAQFAEDGVVWVVCNSFDARRRRQRYRTVGRTRAWIRTVHVSMEIVLGWTRIVRTRSSVCRRIGREPYMELALCRRCSHCRRHHHHRSRRRNCRRSRHCRMLGGRDQQWDRRPLHHSRLLEHISFNSMPRRRSNLPQRFHHAYAWLFVSFVVASLRREGVSHSIRDRQHLNQVCPVESAEIHEMHC
jgi:hypothetical protein